LVLAKDENGTSVQKLTVVQVSATKHLFKVNTCPKCHISAMSYFFKSFNFFLKKIDKKEKRKKRGGAILQGQRAKN